MPTQTTPIGTNIQIELLNAFADIIRLATTKSDCCGRQILSCDEFEVCAGCGNQCSEI